jgi:hypothetical protein
VRREEVKRATRRVTGEKLAEALGLPVDAIVMGIDSVPSVYGFDVHYTSREAWVAAEGAWAERDE